MVITLTLTLTHLIAAEDVPLTGEGLLEDPGSLVALLNIQLSLVL